MRRVTRRVAGIEVAAPGTGIRSAPRRIARFPAGTGRISPHNQYVLVAPAERVALAISFEGSTMCGAPFS